MSISPLLFEPLGTSNLVGSYPTFKPTPQSSTENLLAFQALLTPLSETPNSNPSQPAETTPGKVFQFHEQSAKTDPEEPFDVRLGIGYVPQFNQQPPLSTGGGEETLTDQTRQTFGAQRLDLMAQNPDTYLLPGLENVVQQKGLKTPTESKTASLKTFQTSSLLQDWRPNLETSFENQKTDTQVRDIESNTLNTLHEQHPVPVHDTLPKTVLNPFHSGQTQDFFQVQLKEGTSSPQGQAVIAQVLEHLPSNVVQQEGSQQFKIQLHPKELGEIQIHVTVSEGGNLQAAFSGATKALEALQQGTQLLCNALQQQGFQVQPEAFSFSSNLSFQQESKGKESGSQSKVGMVASYQQHQPAMATVMADSNLNQWYRSQGTGLNVNLSV